MPKISVITPVYNGEKYLEETIQSVLDQTYTDFEYLIVDHASNDSSIEIIRKYQKIDNRIKIIQLDINKGGPAYPRNEGIRVAQGEYLAFVDADDVWKPHKLQTQINFFNIHDDIDMLYTGFDLIDENGKPQGRAKNHILKNIFGIFMKDSKLIFYISFININTLIIKKDTLILFNEEPFLIAIEDWMFHILNFQAGKKGTYLNENLINYRVHLSSLSSRLSDRSYRKIFYMYSLLLLESKISFLHFFFASILNSGKLLRRKIAIAWSPH